MTSTNPFFSKRLAKEILIFFAGLAFVGLTWSFVTLRNNYYTAKRKSLKTEIEALSHQLDSLPKDYIKELYDRISKFFVVKYQVEQEILAVPKKQENHFTAIKKNATSLPISLKGYSYIRSDIFKKYGGYELILGKIANQFTGMTLDLPKGFIPDSTIVFDYVELNRFRELLLSADYSEKFYAAFGQEKFIIDSYTEDGLPIVKPGTDLGSFPKFNETVQFALKNHDSIAAIRQNISKDFEEKKLSHIKAQASIWSDKKRNNVFLTTTLILTIILYPARLSFLIIKWAFKTLK